MAIPSRKLLSIFEAVIADLSLLENAHHSVMSG
jgi:hypothetical protein